MITREQAIKEVGSALVGYVEGLNCEPTNRVYDHDEGEIEWSASVTADDGVELTVFYYTDLQDQLNVEEFSGGDWSNLDWEARIGGYEIY